MNDLIMLDAGIAAIFISLIYFILRGINKKLRRHMLRFEQIRDKF
jgi:hypothetical protein